MTTNRLPWNDTRLTMNSGSAIKFPDDVPTFRYDEGGTDIDLTSNDTGWMATDERYNRAAGITVTEQDMAEAREILALTPLEEQHAFLTGYLGGTLERLAASDLHGDHALGERQRMADRATARALALYRAHRELDREATP